MRIFLLTAVCIAFFSLNAILCRLALISYGMGALQYASIRCVSGGFILLALWLGNVFSKTRQWRELRENSSWVAGIFLFLYMIFFACAYTHLTSATGNLIQNTLVQATMIGWGVAHGMRPSKRQYAGVVLAFIGLGFLLAPGLSTPPLLYALLMAGTGIMWGSYCLCGRFFLSPQLASTGNFLRASCFGIVALMAGLWIEQPPVWQALACAVVSGAITSALAYTLWYYIVPRISVMSASVVQLSVPPLTAFFGLIILGEMITLRLIIATIIILGGIFLSLQHAGKT